MTAGAPGPQKMNGSVRPGGLPGGCQTKPRPAMAIFCAETPRYAEDESASHTAGLCPFIGRQIERHRSRRRSDNSAGVAMGVVDGGRGVGGHEDGCDDQCFAPVSIHPMRPLDASLFCGRAAGVSYGHLLSAARPAGNSPAAEQDNRHAAVLKHCSLRRPARTALMRRRIATDACHEFRNLILDRFDVQTMLAHQIGITAASL